MKIEDHKEKAWNIAPFIVFQILRTEQYLNFDTTETVSQIKRRNTMREGPNNDFIRTFVIVGELKVRHTSTTLVMTEASISGEN